ncbi:MAG: ATP-binding protein [Sulfuritalea sp.]|nr:ATP-binding protein [Sulfuritalea sp.]
MKLQFFRLGSLRRKIVFGYGAVVVLVLGLSAFSLVEMRLLEAQIAAGERIGRFLGLALEIRRFEKNYLLYRQAADLEENRAYVQQARQLLAENGSILEAIERPERIAALRATLDRYAGLMSGPAGTDGYALREAEIRQAGKEIATTAENWSRSERTLMQSQLNRHRMRLLGSIAAIIVLLVAIGQWLSWRVARPLKQLEKNMAAVGAGRLAKLEMAAQDREIASLTQAFNHVLHELELRQGQLVRSEKLAALGTLLSGVAHELNNPLSNISTSCEILVAEVGAGDTAFQKELLEQIDGETWRARRIVRSLLDYARDRPFSSAPVALAPLVEDSLRLVRGQLPAQVAIHVAIADELVVHGDKQRLQQALFNLVGNAVDALEGAGKITVAARAAAAPCPTDALVFGHCANEDDTIEIEVADNGHGIAPQDLPRIFDPFFTTKEVGCGLGLGLFIVFEIIEEHGGCIAVKSEPGRGTSFLIRLPAKDRKND